MTEPFISLEDLSDALGEDVTTSDVAVIALDSACQEVRDEISNIVNLTTTYLRPYDGQGSYRLVLREPPVREVLEVLLDDVAVEVDDYVLEHSAFLRRISAAWPIGRSNLKVSYRHGWNVSESLVAHETHLTHNDSHFEMFDARAAAQTFTPSDRHDIGAVDVGVHIEGTPPNALTVGIYATDDDGAPTGTALGSGSCAVADADTPEGSILRTSITPVVDVLAGVTYAIVCSTTAGDASNDWHWTFDSTAADYSGGQKLTTLDGVTWTATSTHDFIFTEFETFERVPSSIRQVALALATRIFRSYGATATSSGALTSEQIGGYRYTVDASSAVALASRVLLPDERTALARYMPYGFA